MSTQPHNLKEYPRPDLTPDEITVSRRLATRVLQQPFNKRIEFLHALIMENQILTKEVQQHRDTLGYEPLKVYP